MFHTHHKSHHHAPRRCPCDERRAPACREADAGQCRIIVNALRREIDRLIREGAGRPVRFGERIILVDKPATCAAADSDLASPPRHRKAYAMPAAPSTRCADGDRPPWRFASQVHAYLQVTNLGTLLDVLG